MENFLWTTQETLTEPSPHQVSISSFVWFLILNRLLCTPVSYSLAPSSSCCNWPVINAIINIICPTNLKFRLEVQRWGIYGGVQLLIAAIAKFNFINRVFGTTCELLIESKRLWVISIYTVFRIAYNFAKQITSELIDPFRKSWDNASYLLKCLGLLMNYS